MDEAFSAAACGYKNGKLPSCAPIAAAYIPMQQSDEPRYDKNTALAKGTLFPGLDLPFKNISNNALKADTPLSELMAMSFVLDEMGLYLDTHKEDSEAFEVYKKCAAAYKAGKEKYIERFGPLCKNEAAEFDKYLWLDSPWPWEFNERQEG